jgi:predicted amidohydrolase YtcJ
VLGPERAARISPAASALKRGIPFTQHHDAPVALPSSMMILFSQVNRVTRSGQVLGPEQRRSRKGRRSTGLAERACRAEAWAHAAGLRWSGGGSSHHYRRVL